jgi:hypothetical protein
MSELKQQSEASWRGIKSSATRNCHRCTNDTGLDTTAHNSSTNAVPAQLALLNKTNATSPNCLRPPRTCASTRRRSSSRSASLAAS